MERDIAAMEDRKQRVLTSLTKKPSDFPIHAFTLIVKDTDLQTVANLILGEDGLTIKGRLFGSGPEAMASRTGFTELPKVGKWDTKPDINLRNIQEVAK
jgi:hypothetical protein